MSIERFLFTVLYSSQHCTWSAVSVFVHRGWTFFSSLRTFVELVSYRAASTTLLGTCPRDVGCGIKISFSMLITNSSSVCGINVRYEKHQLTTVALSIPCYFSAYNSVFASKLVNQVIAALNFILLRNDDQHLVFI